MSWKAFVRGIASIFDFAGALGPSIDDFPTNEEAFEIDRQKLEEDYKNAFNLHQQDKQ